MAFDITKTSLGGAPTQSRFDINKTSLSTNKTKRYTDLYSKVGFDTLAADLQKASKTATSIIDGWQDAETMKNAKGELANIRDRLSAYENFRSQYGANNVDMSEVLKAYDNLYSNFDKQAADYAKFENKAEYDEAVKALAEKTKNDKKDLSIYDKEIADIDTVLKKANELNDAFANVNKGLSSKKGKAYYSQKQEAETAKSALNAYLKEQGYENLDELKEAASTLKANRKSAERHQALNKIKQPIVIRTDFEELSKYNPEYDNKDTDTRSLESIYKLINGKSETGNVTNANSLIYPVYYEDGETKLTQPIAYYQFMKDDEKKVFNYLFNTGKTEEAKKYLGTLNPTLEGRAASILFETYLKDNGFLEAIYGVGAGLDQFGQGIVANFSDRDYIEPSLTAKVGSMAREDLGDGVGGVVYDALQTTANMAPSILASVASNMIVPGSGGYVAAGLMGGSAAGNAYAQGLNSGMDKDQARTYSLLVGASEAVLSKVLSGISAFGGNAAQTALTTAVSKIETGILRFIGKMAIKGSGEAVEEMLQEVLDPLFENIALGYSKNGFEDIDWGEVVYSGLMALATTGILETVPTAREVRREGIENKKNKLTFNTPEKQGDLVAEGLAQSTESEANKLAAKLKERLDSGKKLKGGQLTAQLSANLESKREANKPEIKKAAEKRLKQLGEKQNVPQIAEIVAKIAVGEDLTKAESKVIAESEHASRVANEVSPINAATNSYTKFWNGVIDSASLSNPLYRMSLNTGGQETVPNGNTEGNANENKPLGFTEPNEKTIRRPLTYDEQMQEISGQKKTTTMRHIEDLGKKLDPNLKIRFVPNNFGKLQGHKGAYERSTNTMYLAKDLNTVEAYAELFKHEFVHRLELKKAYQGFKNYLFNKSKAFEEYAVSRLATEGDTKERTREEAVKDLVDMYLQKNEGMTRDVAEREAVADFVARTLFKGNTPQLRVALTESTQALQGIETDLKLFEELARDDRNLFQKIIDAIKDFIANIKHIPQFKDLEADLAYIEERLSRVYNSADKNKTATDSGVVYEGAEFFADDLSKETTSIKEQIKDAQDVLNKMDVVYSGQVPEYVGTKKTAANWVVEQLKKFGFQADRQGFGKIVFSEDEIRSAMKYLDDNEEKVAFVALYYVLKRGIQVGNHGNHKLRQKSTVTFAAPIELNGVRGNMAVVVNLNGNKYYVHRIVMPDGSAFRFNKKDAKQELYQGVPKRSLADTTSFASDTSISNNDKNVKQKQLEIINETNPAPNSYNTWVRSVDDIKTLLETLEDSDWQDEEINPDLTRTDIQNAIDSGKITVYSSYPIENGVFVSPSQMEAESYSGNGKVYQKEIDIKDVAWIDPTQGQYAKVENVDNTNLSFSSDDLNAKHGDLLDRYEQGEISRDEYLTEMDSLYGQAVDEYGAIKKGEYNETDMPVPKAVAEDMPTARFAKTFIGAAKLTPEMVNEFESNVLLGKFSHTIVSDESAINKAKKSIESKTAENSWENLIQNGGFPSKNQIAIGEQLLATAIADGDTFKTMKLASELADIFTRAGQVVQAARLLGKMTGAGRLVSAQRFVDSLNKDRQKKYGVDVPPITIDEHLAELLATAEGKKAIEQAYQEIMKSVAAQTEATFLDKWNAWRYFAMLCNPRTHIRNLFGNAIFWPSVRLKGAIATGLEKFIAEEKRTKTIALKKEYRDFAKRDVKLQESQTALKGGKYDDKSTVRQNRATFETNWLEKVTSFNSNLLEVEDMWFKNTHYVYALGSFLQSRKVDLNNVDQKTLDAARAYAIKEAQKATFNDANEVAKKIQRLSEKNIFTNALIEGLLPFKRTPLNIIKRGVEYSPIGLINSLTKGLYDVRKGKITADQFIDGIASGTTGLITFAVGCLFGALGWAGGANDDEDKAWYEKMLGSQEYALKFGNSSYTIDWSAPSSIPFFIGVELYETIKEEGVSLDAVFTVLGNSLEPIINLSALSGLQSTIESVRYSEGNVLSAALIDIVTNYGLQSIPSLLGAVGRTVDDKQRTWYVDKNSKVPTFLQERGNSIMSKVPGLSYLMPEKVDGWGRTMTRGGVGERLVENFVSPGYYSEEQYTNVDKEVEKIYKSTKLSGVLPSSAKKSFTVDKKDKNLTADEYVTYAKAKGQNSFEYINELINHAEYAKLNDEQKAKVIISLYEYANAKAKTIVSDYDLMPNYKTVTLRERNGGSAVDYYIRNARKN